MILVAAGIRSAGGWMKDCFSTVIRPPDLAADDVISRKIQSRAAPIPRSGSSWSDSVCRVPNETSLRTIASTRSGSTAARIARSSSPGGCGLLARPGPSGQSSPDWRLPG